MHGGGTRGCHQRYRRQIVHEWAAPQFAEQAARELLEERWEKFGAERLGLDHARLG